MIGLNHLAIDGNLCRDPQLRFLANERCVASFSIAHNRRYKSGGEQHEEVTFLDCEAWGDAATNIGKFFHKGKHIVLEGRIKQESWTDKKSGEKRSKLVLVVKEWHFGKDGKRDSDDAPRSTDADASGGEQPAAAPTASSSNDEPPF